jgi:uncharacterized damage-inducible protein DinB
MSLTEHHRKMLAYENQANRAVIASLRTVPSDRTGSAEFNKARGVLAHTQMARRMWLSRLGAIGRPEWIMFPDWSIERIESEMADLDRVWANYLETLREGDLSRSVHYMTTEGKQGILTIGEILTHVPNHSSYHRGQVAMLVTACGGERASTDFVIFYRRTA